MFKISTVARLAGTNANNVRALLHRKDFMFEEGDIAFQGDNGQANLLSEDGAMRLAIFCRLLARGIPSNRAFSFISQFMDIGEFVVAPDDVRRDPGELFESGETVLVGYVDEPSGKVVNIHPATKVFEIFEMGRTDAFMINISQIKRQLDASLTQKA